ncbi:MAG: YraN family protein [Hyphomonas sp.]
MADPARKRAEQRGRRSETFAALFLRLKGYKILEMRAKTPLGEVDIIAQRGRVICFIEVKARKTRDNAAHAVPPHNWQRIGQAADFWMKRRQQYADYGWRYDLIAIGQRQWPLHITDAWRPGD